MRYGIRFISASSGPMLLQRGWLGGPWFDEEPLQGMSLTSLAKELLIMAPAARSCLGAEEIAVFRFPLTQDVLLHTEVLLSRAFGGRLPEPSARYPWRGNGFAPSLLEQPEYYLLPVPYPERTAYGHWSGGGFHAQMVFSHGAWREE